MFNARVFEERNSPKNVYVLFLFQCPLVLTSKNKTLSKNKNSRAFIWVKSIFVSHGCWSTLPNIECFCNVVLGSLALQCVNWALNILSKPHCTVPSENHTFSPKSPQQMFTCSHHCSPMWVTSSVNVNNPNRFCSICTGTLAIYCNKRN